MADNRFFPWFELELGAMPVIAPEGASRSEIEKLEKEATALAAALKTLLPINRNFYEADVKVTMRYALVGNTFEVTVAGLSPTFYDAIKVGETSIKITLGYYKGMPDQQVLEGVIQKKSAKAGECFYETTLSGIEKGFHLLQATCLGSDDKFPANTKIGDLLKQIAKRAKLDPPKEVNSASDKQIGRDWSFDKKSALAALKQVQERLRQIDGYTLSVRDGQIWYGRAAARLNNAGQVIGDPVYSYDNYLVKTDPADEDRGGQRSPCANKEKKSAPVGYDFEMLGDPRLRPGDTAQFKVKEKDEEKVVPLTIESITHDFSRTRGYRCTGRALAAERFLDNVFKAMAPGAETVGEEVNNMLARNQETYPAVNVGDITDYTAEEHLANAKLGLEFEPTVTSPSVQVRLGAKGFALERRPIVSRIPG